jgi:hypothetical protein
MSRNDLDIWAGEIDRALAGLKGLERAMRDHLQELQSRRESISAEQQTLRAHERALAEFEAGGSGADLVRLARPHREIAEQHARQQRAHESLKKRHHTAMAYWTMLVEALTRPAQSADRHQVGAAKGL